MTTQYTYGTNVVEFYPYSDDEYQKLFEDAKSQYERRSEGLHYKGNAAQVDFVRHKPLTLSLVDLQDELNKGFTVVHATAESLYFKVILRKPADVIAAELVTLAETVKAAYEEDRWNRNQIETARRIEETVFAKRRAAEAAAIAAARAKEDKKAMTEEAAALAELMAAYSQPAATEAAA